MIAVEHLTKRYGDFLALDDLSFEIDEGHVYGFLGPNGAGKSTTMNIMAGCLSATAGSVKIDGYDIFSQAGQAKKLIGYLPEQPPLYMNETPSEYLRFVGEAKGLRGKELEHQLMQVSEQTKINEVKHKKISALSKGYKQRVGIAQALLGNPRVIILDEPTVGLDPLQIIEIRDLIRQLGQEHTVIFSSHILPEVQAICDEILMIAHGKLIAFDEPENLERNLLSSNEINFTAEADVEEVAGLLQGIENIADTSLEGKKDGVTSVRLKIDTNDTKKVSRALFFAFADARKALLELSVKKTNLEELFIELTGNETLQPTGEKIAGKKEDRQEMNGEEAAGKDTMGEEAVSEEAADKTEFDHARESGVDEV